MVLYLIVANVVSFIAFRLRITMNKRRIMKEKEPKPTGRNSSMPVAVWGITLFIMLFPVGILIDPYLIPEEEYHVEITEIPIVQMNVDQNGHEKFISIRGGKGDMVQLVYAKETENGVVIKGKLRKGTIY